MGSSPPHRHPRLDGIREVASRESAEIVLEAAARIARLVAEAEAELRVLKGTVDATASGEDRTNRNAAATDGPASLLPVSASARHALEDARRVLDRFVGELASSSGETTRFRIRRTSALLGGLTLLLAAGALGLATGWLAIPPTGARLETSADVPPASGHSAAAVQVAAPIPAAARPDADELRDASTTFLRAYLDGRPTAMDARLASAVVRDERGPSERLKVPAARRTIAPARVDVFGDAAVLSASVTERSADGRELISLVSQLWTRKDGRWYLDDVRIVSAAGAEQAFRR